jgi:hypothetical protein
MEIVLAIITAGGLLLAWLALTAEEPAAPPAPDPAAVEPITARLAAWLRRAGVDVTPSQFLNRVALGGLLLGGGVWAATGSLVLALVVVGGGLVGLRTVIDRRALRRERRLALDLEILISQLAGLIALDIDLHTAFLQLREQGPVSLRPACAGVIRAAGPPGGLAAGLATLRDSVGPAADDLVEALVAAHRHGARVLLTVLDQLLASLRGQREVRTAIATAQFTTVVQARILLIAPFVMLALLRGIAPGMVAVYDTPLGMAWLLGIAALVGVAYWLMDRLGRVAAPPRVRRGP